MHMHMHMHMCMHMFMRTRGHACACACACHVHVSCEHVPFAYKVCMCMLQAWATVVKDAGELTNEELRASFDLIDVDGNGCLNAKELEAGDRPLL